MAEMRRQAEAEATRQYEASRAKAEAEDRRRWEASVRAEAEASAHTLLEQARREAEARFLLAEAARRPVQWIEDRWQEHVAKRGVSPHHHSLDCTHFCEPSRLFERINRLLLASVGNAERT